MSLNDEIQDLMGFADEKMQMEFDITRYENGTYIIRLIKGDEEVGVIIADIVELSIKEGKTRRSVVIDRPTIYIKDFYIEEDYQRKSIGQFLLLFCLIYLINLNPSIRWATLDDVSDRSEYVKNIYSSMGFDFSGHTELKSNKTVKSYGSEKQMNIKYFLENLHRIIAGVKKNVIGKERGTKRKRGKRGGGFYKSKRKKSRRHHV
jgi:GNAT superfamily N-acetyltransferase